MDQLTLQRINLLHPKIRQEAREAYNHINQKLFGKSVRLRFTHTLRSFEEQDKLYSQGRTILYNSNGQRLKRVTNAKAGQSLHNYGLAIDIVLLVDKDNNGIFKDVSWDISADYDKDNVPEWSEAVNYLKKSGWCWGGDWKSFPDYPHFEKTLGHTWKSLNTLYHSGKTFEEIIDGKIYKWVNI